MTVTAALMRLRVELFGAAQMLQGEDAREFWQLIDDVNAIRPSVEQGASVGLSDEEIAEVVDEESNDGR